MFKPSRVLALVLLTGCLSESDIPIDDLATAEGARGQVTVRTVDGTRTLDYVVANGHAIHEGDIDLGLVEDLHQRSSVAELGKRWPNSTVYFRFAAGFVGQTCGATLSNCVDSRARVRTILESMAQKLPLVFVEDTNELATNYVEFGWAANDANFGGLSNHVGMDGGKQTIVFKSGHLDDTTLPEWSPYNLMPNAGTLEHEMLHAVGLWHEQSRNDRDSFITVNTDCIQPSELGEFAKQPGATSVGPYDFQSLMHYPIIQYCVSIGIPNPNKAFGTCVCPSITSNFASPGGAIFGSKGATLQGGFSIEDTNALFRMYARASGSNDANDHYGRAVAIGDFDNDGYDDLAVGTPDEEIVTSVSPIAIATNAGRVVLYRGTSTGLIAWAQLTEQDHAGTATANGRFGAALAALDTNGDGITDLAVGAPGANGNAGAVFTFLGNVTGKPRFDRMLTQQMANYTDEAGDRFGEALAAGRITGAVAGCDKTTGSAIDALVVGAPGDRNEVPRSQATTRSGAAYIFQDVVNCTIVHAKPTRINGTGGATGDDYGAAIAVGDLDGDGKADVAIGAPHRNGDAGAVYTYAGRQPPESPATWSAMVIAKATISGAGTLFGSAIAIGDVDTDVAGAELVVGAPGGTGTVQILAGGVTPLAIKNLFDFTLEAGDRFGAALAIGNLDPNGSTADLVIGIPGEDSGAGAIAIVRGGTLTARTTLRQSNLSPLFDNAANDEFGASLAVGHLDGRGPIASTADVGARLLDLAIGAPGEAPDVLLGPAAPAGSGGVSIMIGNLFGVPTVGTQISQAFVID